MGAIVMKQFIDKFKAMEKIANETLAANPEALVGVDSMPGSEHDKKVPEEAKKPDAEVAQGQPSGATSAEGAVNGGDAKPLNEGKLEMDQPLLNPEKKPEITDDALTAKVANAHLASLVNDLLADLKPDVQKQAAAKPAAQAPAEGGEEKKATTKKQEKITIDSDMLNKIAAAQAAYLMGQKAAENALKASQEKKAGAENQAEGARALIKAACIKAAQESGLDPAAAEAAANNVMAAAGVAGEDAGAAAADAGAAEAAAEAGAAEAGAGEAPEIPENVTEEELATAIVDLVSSGELDLDTAKALVEEIAGDAGGVAPDEDQAAEIIAQGLESGEITPEQAQEIAAAVETGAAEDAGSAAADAGAEAADAGAEAAEAQGAADAAAAIQDAQDEAQGAADAEAAMKAAAAMIRQNAISKVAGAVVAKRNEKSAAAKAEQTPKPGSRVMSKVASILDAKAKAQQPQDKDASYIAGFKKKAEEMGVDPAALARYVCETQAK